MRSGAEGCAFFRELKQILAKAARQAVTHSLPIKLPDCRLAAQP